MLHLICIIYYSILIQNTGTIKLFGYWPCEYDQFINYTRIYFILILTSILKKTLWNSGDCKGSYIALSKFKALGKLFKVGLISIPSEVYNPTVNDY